MTRPKIKQAGSVKAGGLGKTVENSLKIIIQSKKMWYLLEADGEKEGRGKQRNAFFFFFNWFLIQTIWRANWQSQQRSKIADLEGRPHLLVCCTLLRFPKRFHAAFQLERSCIRASHNQLWGLTAPVWNILLDTYKACSRLLLYVVATHQVLTATIPMGS